MKTRLAAALLLVSLLLCACGSSSSPSGPNFFAPENGSSSSPEATPVPTTEIVVVTPSPATAAPVTPAPATPTPAPATPAPSTPAPATPAPSGSSVKLTSDLQYRINIFLSNFSEQFFGPFNVSTASDDQMIAFVHIYCKINNRNAILYQGGYETISLDDMNAQLRRFFDVSCKPNDGVSYMLDAWTIGEYHDGYFWFPAADGESYNYFTVVDSMTRNSDGTYSVQFQVYALNLDEYWSSGIDNAFYRLNPDQVADLVWSDRVTPVQGGTAVVRDYTKSNGVATYQLISYDIWNITF